MLADPTAEVSSGEPPRAQIVNDFGYSDQAPTLEGHGVSLANRAWLSNHWGHRQSQATSVGGRRSRITVMNGHVGAPLHM
jgi:hypothetical protein